MASRRKPTSRRKPPASKAEEKVDGILIALTPGEDSDQVMNIKALGNVRITELPTVLELAAKQVRQQLGLEGG